MGGVPLSVVKKKTENQPACIAGFRTQWRPQFYGYNEYPILENMRSSIFGKQQDMQQNSSCISDMALEAGTIAQRGTSTQMNISTARNSNTFGNSRWKMEKSDETWYSSFSSPVRAGQQKCWHECTVEQEKTPGDS